MKHYYFKSNLFYFILISLAAFTQQESYAQCAGNDTTITICNIPDSSNQNFNLFNALQGAPQAGGTWTDNDNLNIYVGSSTDIINIWEINQGGTYTYTYTVNSTGCTDNTATLTLNIGGYAGVNNFDANACENDTSVNLFQFIGNNPNPHLFGTWVDVDNTGALTGSFYNATIQGVGSYTFTYTVPAVGSCPAQTVTVELTVHPLPDPNEATYEFEICGPNEIANHANFDLLTIVQPTNGFWTEDSGTNELTSPSDTIIDIQNIFNTFGYGDYNFSYTSLPSHPVCEPQVVTVIIKIKRELDFSAATINIESICINEINNNSLDIEILDLPNLTDLPSNLFEITYQLNGPTNFSGTYQFILNDPVNFTITPDNPLQEGTYTIIIDDFIILNDPNELICNIIYDLEDTFEIWPIFEDNLDINIDDICEGENIDILITHPDNTFGETLDITYDVSGANTISNANETLTFTNGEATITIDISQFPNIGNHTFEITSVTNQFGCVVDTDFSDDFEIFELPPSTIGITIDDVCLGEAITIELGNLTNLNQIELIYSIETGIISQQNINLSVNNGMTNFTVDGSNFTTPGTYDFEIHEITNLQTGCSSLSTSNLNFEIYPIPNPPNVNPIQEFCEADNPTVADLSPNATNIFWYENQTSITPLSATQPLTNTTYWVAQTNAQGCVSDKVFVDVIVNQVPQPTLVQDGNKFCGIDNPTVADLTSNIIQGTTYNVVCYDQNGNQLPPSTLLDDNETYYAYLNDAVTGCDSSTNLEIQVTLTNCDPNNPVYDFFIPDAFSPNNDGNNDVFRIPNISFLFPDYSYEIYNRYGKRLFVGDIQNPEWNGETNAFVDGVAPNGVYFYIVYFNKDNKPPQQGRLYLNR
ncbi:gliding motility-associated C-terminal domain-containing protein [Mesonia sp. K7]|uniref:T9SS type B sorting domain-containing protein n=1 Tax=Mesonia sp. K7 TaxID=2218606 RepID=UPI000DA8C3B4|nr:gliding motility-associated C-terminal domain-containing protein [Mesonia sp. K7]PZD78115.1 hypothetical protein DNG35_07015 [Mesonia sp. K7]